MKIWVTVFLLFISTLIFSQQNFENIDNKSKNVPKHLKTTENITNHLIKDLDSDTEKLRAIYVWITHNIQYDLSYLDGNRRYASAEKLIEDALKYKKGVCQHYSDLFKAMCEYAGIEAYTITGYVRDNSGGIFEFDHAWNGIILDSDYYLIDATWGSGYISGNKFVQNFDESFFLVKPEDFIKTHMPFDPIWQFLSNPISNKEFISRNFSKLNSVGNYKFMDIIDNMGNLDKTTELEESSKRITASGVVNGLIQEHLDDMNIRISIQKFNKAVDSLNYGINNYNKYLSHKNKDFADPKIDEIKIKELLSNAESGIYFAHNILKSVSTKDNDLNEAINNTRKMVPQLISNLEKEKEFTNKFFKSKKKSKLLS